MTEDWTSFWDLASPQTAADTLLEFFGADAAIAAAHCAIAARGDDRGEDYRFWTATFNLLRVEPVTHPVLDMLTLAQELDDHSDDHGDDHLNDHLNDQGDDRTE